MRLQWPDSSAMQVYQAIWLLVTRLRQELDMEEVAIRSVDLRLFPLMGTLYDLYDFSWSHVYPPNVPPMANSVNRSAHRQGSLMPQ